jgi:hypothetical protein
MSHLCPTCGQHVGCLQSLAHGLRQRPPPIAEDLRRSDEALGEIENWIDRWYGGNYGSSPSAEKTFAEIGKILERWRTNG